MRVLVQPAPLPLVVPVRRLAWMQACQWAWRVRHPLHHPWVAVVVVVGRRGRPSVRRAQRLQWPLGQLLTFHRRGLVQGGHQRAGALLAVWSPCPRTAWLQMLGLKARQGAA